MEANKILSADVLDLIFEDRNKDYGAYDLRKTYNKRIIMALVITASIALLALIGSVLASTFKSSDDNKPVIKEVTIQDLLTLSALLKIHPASYAVPLYVTLLYCWQ